MGMCKCGGLRKTKPISNYVVPGALLGIENVTLVDGVFDELCEKCGKGKITILDLPGLIAAVALTRVKLPFKLNNKELRFLRKALEISGKEMAEHLKVSPETLSRWENEKLPISEQSEMLLRMIVIALLHDKAEAVDPEMEAVAKMNIQAAYDPAALAALMHFVRVSTLRDRKADAEQHWKDERKVANG
jgi:transcriptional regulator with XRE-family HTH domain